MARKVLFIGSGSPFMVNAVIGNLKKAGYEVVSVEQSPAEIRREWESCGLTVVFLGRELLERDTILSCIAQLATEEKPLFLIGNNEEVRSANRLIPDSLVAEVFNKPVDMLRLVTQINRKVNSSRKEEVRQLLLIDDDPDYLRMVRGWLSHKYQVAIVSSGMQAMTYLANNKPALILLDYSMPVTSGPQVLKMLRSEPETANIPIIFLTGKDDPETVYSVLELKPDGYVLKSVQRTELVERVDEFFAGLEAGN